MLAHEQSGGAGVVEMDVAEQQVADVSQLHSARRECGLQRVDRDGGPAVEQCRAIVGVERVAPDRVCDAFMEEVDRLGRAHAPALARAASTIAVASERLPQPRVSVFFVGSRSL